MATAADKLVQQVREAVRMLAEMTGIGHRRADVTSPRYRFWTVKPYVIAYRYSPRKLTVVRVLHGARDFKAIFRR